MILSSKLQKYAILFLFIAFATGQQLSCNPEDKNSCPSLHNCVDQVCVHKDIFPLTQTEILGSILLMLLAGLANAGGLGGGALLSPILLLIFNYQANKAIMIVYGVVFGGAVGNFLNVAFQRNSKTGKSFVDYDLSLVCMPQMVLGAMVGVLLNRILASFVTIFGLVVVIIYSGRSIYRKAKLQFAAETAKQNSKGNDENTISKPFKLEFEMKPMDEHSKSNVENSDPVNFAETELAEDYDLFPRKKLILICSLLVFAIFMMILKGSKEFSSPLGVEFCGGSYWAIFLITLAGCGVSYFINAKFVRNRAQIRKLHEIKTDVEEFTVTDEITKKMGPLGLIAGVLAGLLGLGGGMIMSPVLIQLGIGPQILAATSGFFVVQTSFLTLFQSFFFGDVTILELLYFVGISFVGSYGVSSVLSYFVKKFERPSIILFALSSVLLISLVVLPTFGLYKSIDNPSQMFTFHSIC